MTDINDIKTNAEKFLATKKLELAARNLRHYIKIQEEQVSLDTIVESIQSSADKAQTGNPEDFSKIIAEQAHILNAAFQFYMDKAISSPYSEEDKVKTAFMAQRQTANTINTWRRIEQFGRIVEAEKAKKAKKEQKLLKNEKRTEQNDGSHAPLER